MPAPLVWAIAWYLGVGVWRYLGNNTKRSPRFFSVYTQTNQTPHIKQGITHSKY